MCFVVAALFVCGGNNHYYRGGASVIEPPPQKDSIFAPQEHIYLNITVVSSYPLFICILGPPLADDT